MPVTACCVIVAFRRGYGKHNIVSDQSQGRLDLVMQEAVRDCSTVQQRVPRLHRYRVKRRSLLIKNEILYFTERNGTERNAGLFHGMDKCDNGKIKLNIRIFNTERIHIDMLYIAIVLINRILTRNEELDDRGKVN